MAALPPRLGQPWRVRSWWIDRGRAAGHDVEGGWLWSPPRRVRSRLHDAMRHPAPDNVLRLAAPGDAILAGAEGLLTHVGRVAGRAMREEAQGGEGWWLPVDWTPLPHPVETAMPPPDSLAALPDGRFHDLLDEAGATDWLALPPDPAPDPQLAESRLGYASALEASVRDQTIRARRGQGLFRFRVFQLESACRLTGIARPDLLIASHIKPWRLCETTQERLDGANGLLLTPHVDRLFDRGLISFSDDGAVLRSPALPGEDLARLGLDRACAGNVGRFSDRQRAYLASHRALVFGRGR